MTDGGVEDSERRERDDAGEGQTPHEGWQYLGVGCVTAVAGLFGGGMIAVLLAKIVGAVRHCKADGETGAPCDWATWWSWGARIGVVVLPILSIWLLRRGRQRSKNSERG